MATSTNLDTFHCRLCALSKCTSKLVSIQSSFAEENRVIDKLEVINLSFTADDHLPKMVCLPCYDKLDSATEFIKQVNNAQRLLRNMYDPFKWDVTTKNGESAPVEFGDEIKDEKFAEVLSIDVPALSQGTVDANALLSFSEAFLEVKNECSPAEVDISYDASLDFPPACADTEDADTVDYGGSIDSRTQPHCRIRYSRIAKDRGLSKKKHCKIKIKLKDLTGKKSGKKRRTLSDSKSPTDYDILLNPYLRSEEGENVRASHEDSQVSEGTPPPNSWAQYSWDCFECSKLFPRASELTAHWLHAHKSCVIYNCIDCFKPFSGYGGFMRHVMLHRKHLAYSCDICYATYANDESGLSQLRSHRKKHGFRSHPCPNCNISLGNLDLLRKHLEIYAKGIAKKESRSDMLKKKNTRKPKPTSWVCKICDKVCKSQTGLAVHLIIHTERNKDHTCDQCGKSFLARSSLKDHIRNSHREYRPYECEICHQTFSWRNRLNSHMSLHTGDKTFSCSECGRKFRLSQQLKRHSIVHTDRMPYSCTFCDKKFRFPSTCKTHLRTHTGETPYDCGKCSKAFANWPNYNKHMKRIHNIDTSKRQKMISKDAPIADTELTNCPSNEFGLLT